MFLLVSFAPSLYKFPLTHIQSHTLPSWLMLTLGWHFTCILEVCTRAWQRWRRAGGASWQVNRWTLVRMHPSGFACVQELDELRLWRGPGRAWRLSNLRFSHDMRVRGGYRWSSEEVRPWRCSRREPFHLKHNKPKGNTGRWDCLLKLCMSPVNIGMYFIFPVN